MTTTLYLQGLSAKGTDLLAAALEAADGADGGGGIFAFVTVIRSWPGSRAAGR
jgi:hypothetical protein